MIAGTLVKDSGLRSGTGRPPLGNMEVMNHQDHQQEAPH